MAVTSDSNERAPDTADLRRSIVILILRHKQYYRVVTVLIGS